MREEADKQFPVSIRSGAVNIFPDSELKGLAVRADLKKGEISLSPFTGYEADELRVHACNHLSSLA